MPVPKIKTISNLVEGGRALIDVSRLITSNAERDFSKPDIGLKAQMVTDFVTLEVYVRQFEYLMLGYIEGHVNAIAKQIQQALDGKGEVNFEMLEQLRASIEVGDHLVAHFHESDIRNIRWAKESAKRSSEEAKRLKKTQADLKKKLERRIKAMNKLREKHKQVLKQAETTYAQSQQAANDATAYKKKAA